MTMTNKQALRKIERCMRSALNNFETMPAAGLVDALSSIERDLQNALGLVRELILSQVRTDQ